MEGLKEICNIFIITIWARDHHHRHHPCIRQSSSLVPRPWTRRSSIITIDSFELSTAANRSIHFAVSVPNNKVERGDEVKIIIYPPKPAP